RRISVKPGSRRRWVLVAAAMNVRRRPRLYDAFHSIAAVAANGGATIANVVGPVCESGDTFAMTREMDAVATGDLVIFRTAGAYGAAMSNGYNSRPLTPEVLVDSGSWALVRRRVEIDALAACEPPEWLA